jgi:hypothetical protein
MQSLTSALGRARGGDAVAFVSPSQREGSKHADLAALTQIRDYLAGKGHAGDVQDGVGYWADGKEESAAVHTDRGSLVPLLHDLRNRFNQKATIGFHEDATGPDLMHVLRVRDTDPDKIHSDLTRHGVEYKTVIPGKTGSVVYSLDSGGVLKVPVEAYAREQRAHLDTVPGHVHFIGGDERPNPEPVKLALHESVNKAGRQGDLFVKTPSEAGSPHAEAQAARVLKVIGVPHLHVEEKDGNVVGPWRDGLVGLADSEGNVDREGLKRAYNPDHIGRLAFAEHLLNAGDRVGRNYQLDPEHGLIGIDYGHAFHPMTDEHGYHKMMKGRGKIPAIESYKSLASTPTKYAENHPLVSALPGALKNTGLADREQFKSIRVPDRHVRAALANEPALLDAAWKATTDLPEEERQHAVKAMKMRLDAYRDHLTNRGPITIGDLVRITQEVRDEATRRAARPQ